MKDRASDRPAIAFEWRTSYRREVTRPFGSPGRPSRKGEDLTATGVKLEAPA